MSILQNFVDAVDNFIGVPEHPSPASPSDVFNTPSPPQKRDRATSAASNESVKTTERRRRSGQHLSSSKSLKRSDSMNSIASIDSDFSIMSEADMANELALERKRRKVSAVKMRRKLKMMEHVKTIEDEHNLQLQKLYLTMDQQQRKHNEELEKIQHDITNHLQMLQQHHEKQLLQVKTECQNQIHSVQEVQNAKLREADEVYQTKLRECEEVKMSKLREEGSHKVKLRETEDLYKTKLRECEEQYNVKLSEAQKAFNSSLAEAQDKYQSQLAETKQTFAIDSQDQIQLYKMRAQSLEEELKNVQTSLVLDSQNQIQQYKMRAQSLEQELKNMQTNIVLDAQDQIQLYKMRAQSLEEELKNLQEENIRKLKNKDTEIAKVESEKNVLSMKINQYRADIDNLMVRLDQKHSEVKQAERERDEYQKALHDKQAETQKWAYMNKYLHPDADVSLAAREALEENLKLRRLLSKYKNEGTRLKERISLLERSFNKEDQNI